MNTKELDREEEIRKKSAMLKIAARHANWEQIKVIYADEIRQHTKAAVKDRDRILEKYGTSKCDECGAWAHDDDLAFCENCPRAFHEGCAGHTYDGDGEYPSESAYALCKRCANIESQSHNQEERTETPSTNSNLIGGMK